jgi:hypothetical protein
MPSSSPSFRSDEKKEHQPFPDWFWTESRSDAFNEKRKKEGNEREFIYTLALGPSTQDHSRNSGCFP